MYSVTHGIALYGIEGIIVGVEADVQTGLPSFEMVGLAASSIRESKERVRSALINSGFTWPRGRLTVSLSPADWKKDGSGLDLPIAVAILIASEQMPPIPHHTILLGELALDGSIRAFRGLYAAVKCAQDLEAKTIILPATDDIDQLPVEHFIQRMGAYSLSDAVSILQGHPPLKRNETDDSRNHQHHFPHQPVAKSVKTGSTDSPLLDFSEVAGQDLAKRALLISAVGGHHILLYGPPGSGKSMLAERFPSILPSLSTTEFAELKHIYSIAGLSITEQVSPPFRAPHHSITVQGLLGGGTHPKPGEITLAHHGVLFLDELPEFPRLALEGLRQPLETQHITVSRSAYTTTFPCDFHMIAAMNPCPCGYHGFSSELHQCTCNDRDIARYRAKLSGPLLDRIDMTLWITPVSASHWHDTERHTREHSATMLSKVIAARDFQEHRKRTLQTNTSPITPMDRLQTLLFDSPSVHLLIQSGDRLQLSSRSLMKIAHVSRSIADIEQSDHVAVTHVAEALQYRTYTTT